MGNINIYTIIIFILVIFILWILKAFLRTLVLDKINHLELELSDYFYIYKHNINLNDFIKARKRLKEIFTTISFYDFSRHVASGGDINNVVKILEKSHKEGKVLSVKEAFNIDLIKSIADKNEKIN